MPFRSKSIAFVGLGGACVAAFFVLWHRAPEAPEPSAAHAAPVAVRPEPGRAPEAIPTATPVPSSVAPAPTVQGEAEAALRRRLEAAQQVVSVPPAGRMPSAAGAQSLPPQVEAQRQAALLGWKQAAQRLMDSCAARPKELRQPVALEVGFAPRPGGAGASAWTFTPDWIAIPPPELQRLWKDTDPDKLQACLDRARSLSLEVSVPGDTPAHDAPLFAESVLVQL
ncbi:hypothetical protein [Corallococcus carmarthensis]|uniref:Uncharacterized protein n=1 Tax=Corallococcus carmarthensis TaxID=2316728 RepID=A0A3A8KSA7_9BACT|nr:hypothetical protein [Corallococcus carmarthensis]RKH04854.1 hypothetical protein D7X32_09675 [Corallococcus carmarthensis]